MLSSCYDTVIVRRNRRTSYLVFVVRWSLLQYPNRRLNTLRMSAIHFDFIVPSDLSLSNELTDELEVYLHGHAILATLFFVLQISSSPVLKGVVMCERIGSLRRQTWHLWRNVESGRERFERQGIGRDSESRPMWIVRYQQKVCLNSEQTILACNCRHRSWHGSITPSSVCSSSGTQPLPMASSDISFHMRTLQAPKSAELSVFTSLSSISSVGLGLRGTMVGLARFDGRSDWVR